ncbi:hypothetical protein KVR01_007215 [Diaporthe batatas]|uniref:uncharacterized protein n=1 Tax=Diaporthe batatas TaxID=748121 RepID=UPI001D03D772|nr:uncharacterized protein KVR01_007215 [Diaporthe batatas]KAG8162737.1 hypothetical protein KVR01_007215 [Diaporthe batatas]
MASATQDQMPQPTISGYNVEEERSFLPAEDVPPVEPSSAGSSQELDPSSDDDGDGSESPENRAMSLAEELRAEMLRDEIKASAYMPLHVLRAVMTRDRVMDELKKHHFGEEEVQKFANLICPEESDGPEGVYTRVFAALARLDKCQDFDRFVSEGLSDDKLPLRRKDGSAKTRSRFPLVDAAKPSKEIQACKHWTADNRERFYEIQREFLVHFFRHRPERDGATASETARGPRSALIEEIMDTTYLPWKERRMRTTPVAGAPSLNPSASMSSSYAGGAYGSVAPFEIEDKDHNFGPLLDSIGLDGKVFAVKTLRRIPRFCDRPDQPPRDETDDEMRRRFRQEAEVLWRLDGTVHPHLLTMLSALAHDDGHLQLRLIFPWAECDLVGLWELGDKSWGWGAEAFEWMAEQVDGLLGAVERLHEPDHLHHGLLEQGDRRYGLHADIKPDNILLFRSRRHPRGILVLSDFGLSSFHREVTRSNIPNHLVMGTLGYSPPECDVEGGFVSRRYDIWTLGSLFLDMLTWLLGGHKLLEQFQHFAEIQYITGGLRKMFYQILELETQGPDSVHIRDSIIKGTKQEKWYGVQLNPKLGEWIQRLKAREGCSGFVADTLDLIETKMLRLIAAERSDSKHLKREMGKIVARCSSRPDYVFNGKPKPQPGASQGLSPSLGTSLRVTTPIYLTTLKDESREHMRSNHQTLRLPVHSVTKQDSLLPRSQHI